MPCAAPKFVLVATIALLLALAGGAARADSTDADFITGLTERRLFPLAERYIRSRLATQNVTADEQIELTIALSRTLAEHALHTPRSQRDALWQAAAQAADDFRAAQPDHPRRVLVDVQQALTVLARGELARQESEVGAPGAPTLDEARRELQQAITQLRTVADEIEKQLRTAGSAEGEMLTEAELISLARNVSFQQARALRNQALCYAPKSAERADALLQALDLLKPLAQLETVDSLAWKSRLDEAICLRLAGRTTESLAKLDALDAARPPSRVALEARAERTRVQLDLNQPDAALEVLRGGRTQAGQTSAELDLAHIETFIAQWKAAAGKQDAKAAKQWQDRAAEMVRAMEQLYGPYWTRRGELLLAASAGSGGGDENVEVLVRAAKNHYLRQELEEAVIAYERAGKTAESSDRAKALDLYLAAALIERRRQRPEGAIELQRNSSLALRDVAKAPAVHLQAIVDAAQLARDGDSTKLESYAALLEEHGKTWPGTSTGDQAALWLGQLREHEQNWPAALAAYGQVSPSDEQRFAVAVDALGRVYAAQFEQQAAAGKIDEKAVREASTQFREIIAAGAQPPTRWTTPQRQAALHAARLELRFTRSGFADVQKLLEAALAGSDGAPAAWQSQVRSLLVVAQAGAGERAAARQTLEQISGGSPAQQIELLRGLHEIGTQSQPAVAREIAELQLDVAQRLAQQASRLSAADKKGLAVIEAGALAAAGRESEARERYAKLSGEYPDDADVQTRYAQLLLASPDRPSQQAARDAWRNVLRRTKPNTPAWYEAKYSVALAQCNLGEKAEAAQIIRVLQTVDPQLGGPAMKAKFLALLARCR